MQVQFWGEQKQAQSVVSDRSSAHAVPATLEQPYWSQHGGSRVLERSKLNGSVPTLLAYVHSLHRLGQTTKVGAPSTLPHLCNCTPGAATTTPNLLTRPRWCGRPINVSVYLSRQGTAPPDGCALLSPSGIEIRPHTHIIQAMPPQPTCCCLATNQQRRHSRASTCELCT